MSDALLRVYDRDLMIVKGKGSILETADGRRFLDFCAGIAVNGLGHGDPKVVKAIKDQASKVMHISNLYYSEPAARLAERLVSIAFPGRVFFTNSGSEAMEGALKFARRIGREQGRTEFLAFERSFHGRTFGALSLTWTEKYRVPFEPLLPGCSFLPWSDVAAAERAIGPKTAAVVIEPVQGEGGIRVASPEFLQSLAKLCRDRGALLIADEIQCGFTRSGKMFAYEHAAITPDILALAKPLGGGLPMGAIVLREELAHHLQVGDHGSTFGGNPVCAAASLAVLDRLTAPGFAASVEKRGAALMRSLRKIRKNHKAKITDVRGLGLIAGIEFAHDAAPVAKGLRERGVLVVKAGERVVRVLPPLTVKPAEIKEFLGKLDETVASLP